MLNRLVIMLTSAADLARARESAGVSLEEIADRTKIPIRHLRSLEAGSLKYWPPGLYARAYARAYAGEAGLDPAEVVAFVEDQLAPAEPPAQVPPLEPASLFPGPIGRLWHVVVLWRRPQQA